MGYDPTIEDIEPTPTTPEDGTTDNPEPPTVEGEGDHPQTGDSVPDLPDGPFTIGLVPDIQGEPPVVAVPDSNIGIAYNPLDYTPPPAFQKNPNKIMDWFKKVADYIRSAITRW